MTWILALLTTYAACHDAPRSNPVDPALTPAVEITSVINDSLTGSATLTWTPYTGEQPLALYRVLRQEADRIRVDTLAELTSAQRTSYTDTSRQPNIDYLYRIAVENHRGFAVLSPEVRVHGYPADAVDLLAAEVDEATGECRIRWSRFHGGQFRAYRLERRQGADLDFAPIERVEAVDDTTFTDTGLEPNTVYTYQVVVEAAGRDWPSRPSERVRIGLPVIRQVAAMADGLQGTIELRWEPYAGPWFERYEVRGGRLGEEPQLLATLVDRGDTTWTDEQTRAGTAYLYRVVTVAAGQSVESAPVAGTYALPAVTLHPLTTDSRTATATLRWTRYRGARFSAYRVMRSAEGSGAQTVQEITDPGITEFVDVGLRGDTEYRYRLEVVTSRDEVVPSEIRTGILHERQATIPVVATVNDDGRLLLEPDGRLILLLANEDRVSIQTVERERWITGPEQLLFRRGGYPIAPKSAATTLLPDGERLLSLAYGSELLVLPYSTDGQPVLTEPVSFESRLRALVPGREREVQPELRLWNLTAKWAAFDNLRVEQDGQPLYTDNLGAESAGNWQASSSIATFRLDRAEIPREAAFIARREEDSQPWQDLRVAVDVVVEGGQAGVLVGSQSEGSSFLFTLNAFHQEASLKWVFRPASETGLTAQEATATAPVTLVEGLLYRLILEVEEGRISAVVQAHRPYARTPRDPRSRWGGLATLPDGQVLLTEEERPYLVVPAGEGGAIDYSLPSLTDPASEVRIWPTSDSGDREWSVGVCLPQANVVLLSPQPVQAPFRWPFGDAAGLVRLGNGVGHEEGELLYPLSFGAGMDGRIFVLDAGNARVQVFSPEGDQITEWGHRGAGLGELDCGSGSVAGDFRGSLVVDEEGLIYVLDLGNRRIQVFAP